MIINENREEVYYTISEAVTMLKALYSIVIGFKRFYVIKLIYL